MENLNDERIIRMEFLLERMKDRKRFYFNGQVLYFSVIGHLYFFTTKIVGKELRDGRYENVYEVEPFELPLNYLLDLYKDLSPIDYEVDQKYDAYYESNKN